MRFYQIIYLVGLLLISPTTSWFPKILWCYWEVGIQQTDYAMLTFHENHKRILGDEWEIRLLNSTNAKEWTDQIPLITQTFESQNLIAKGYKKRANFLRFALISHFGGVWIDITTILLENFDWMYDLKNCQHIRNKYGESPQVLLQEQQKASKKYQYYDLETKQIMHIVPSLQSYFIVAIPKSRYLIEVVQYYRQGILAETVYDQDGNKKNYLLQKSIKNGYSLGHFGNNPYFQVSFALMAVVHRKQMELDKNWSGREEDPRDLAVKHYKLWTLLSHVGSFKLHYIEDKKRNFALTPLYIVMQSDIDYLKSVNLYPKYFVKFAGGNRKSYIKYFLDNQTKLKLNCQDDMYILENSIGYQYLLKDYPIKFYENNIAKYSFNRNCHLPTFYIPQQQKTIFQIVWNTVKSFIILVLGLVFLWAIVFYLKFKIQNIQSYQTQIQSQQTEEINQSSNSQFNTDDH